MRRAFLKPDLLAARLFGGRGPAPAIAATVLGLLAAPLAACSGDAVRTLATDAGYGPRVVAAPDFVTESRSKEAPAFMPVGVDAPKRPVRAKSSEGQKALEAELEGARGRNESRGRAAESAGRGAAAAIKPAPAAQ
ncbi:hypothetical protein [Methylobacterium pseudosasicola]|uniref:Uncharacterized protein n=1 Tax=Methylobacterium pseudosasicola TaxID=582667 RepID=A0A1I4FKX3_9HYPH|nr:hypothetical protein [Methylobacterium pseudosasicola]SFL18605.1 hypothetical protein SAMN05192568_1001419 [Methylobacterium pseudosasicola]